MQRIHRAVDEQDAIFARHAVRPARVEAADRQQPFPRQKPLRRREPVRRFHPDEVLSGVKAGTAEQQREGQAGCRGGLADLLDRRGDDSGDGAQAAGVVQTGGLADAARGIDDRRACGSGQTFRMRQRGLAPVRVADRVDDQAVRRQARGGVEEISADLGHREDLRVDPPRGWDVAAAAGDQHQQGNAGSLAQKAPPDDGLSVITGAPMILGRRVARRRQNLGQALVRGRVIRVDGQDGLIQRPGGRQIAVLPRQVRQAGSRHRFAGVEAYRLPPGGSGRRTETAGRRERPQFDQRWAGRRVPAQQRQRGPPCRLVLPAGRERPGVVEQAERVQGRRQRPGVTRSGSARTRMTCRRTGARMVPARRHRDDGAAAIPRPRSPMAHCSMPMGWRQAIGTGTAAAK